MTSVTDPAAAPAAAPPADSAAARAETLAEQVFGGIKAALDTFTLHLGVRLGLYRALADGRPHTPDELAWAAGIHRRYAREWLEQQAALGILELAGDGGEPAAQDGAGADPYRQAFRLPEEHADVLVHEDHPLYLGGGPMFCVGIAEVLDQVADAFRSGGGVGYPAYGADVRRGIARLNRPMYVNDLTATWLPALPEVHARLTSGEPLHILDVGCGTGSSSVALAERFPSVRVLGVDLDQASIDEARTRAERQGVADRVEFAPADAATLELDQRFDLAVILEALHDTADPVGVLAAVHRALAEGGVLLVADEQVADTLQSPAGEAEQLTYAASVLHCLPATRAEGAKEEAGAALRSGVALSYGRRAGFSGATRLDIEHDLWNFYRFDR